MTDPRSEFRLDGDVAVVTGGASGIGCAVAAAFAAVGADIAIFDVAAAGGGAYPVDVTNEAQVKAAFAKVGARHGRLDFLFNNAGIALRQPTTDLTLEDWNKVVAVNIDASATVPTKRLVETVSRPARRGCPCGPVHFDGDGVPVPRRWAAEEELLALARVLRAAGRDVTRVFGLSL